MKFQKIWILSVSIFLSAATVQADVLTNDQALKQYNEIINTAVQPSEKVALSKVEAGKIFSEAVKHPVATLSDENIKKYDPDGIIGFCFGRAMTVHMLARRAGLKDSSVRKLFIVGDLTQNPPTPEWRFHVSTLVKVKINPMLTGWYAIDPIMKGPMPVQEWIQYVKKTWDYTKKAQLYLVKSDAILPDISTVPEIAKETGEFLIELKFDPSNKQGFKAATLGGEALYQVESTATDQYFFSVNEPTRPFHFLSIFVNGGEISYRNYFSDLIQTEYAKLKGLLPPPIFHFLTDVQFDPWPKKSSDNLLGSFRFGRLENSK